MTTNTPMPASTDQNEPPQHIRTFGLGTSTVVVVASMVGSGVLTTSGFTVYAVGSNQLMLILWCVGGVLAMCGALTIAELASSIPESGGDYIFLREAYGPLAAFLSGWVSFLLGFGGPIAVSALASARYFVEPWGLPEPTKTYVQLAIASTSIILLAFIHSSGRRQGAFVQMLTTLIKWVVLLVLAVAGLIGGWGNWQNLQDRPPMSLDVGLGMLSSLVFISYAYTGWNGVGYIAGEVKSPQRSIPLAILLGTGSVMLLYLALNLSYALALSAEDVRQIVQPPGESANPNRVAPIAQIAAARLFGDGWSTVLSFAIGVTLLASVSAFVLTGPRVACAMAQAGQFPAIAGRLSSQGVPANATWLQVAWALILLWSGSLENLLGYSSVGLALISLMTISSIFVLRASRPNLNRPFRTPGYPVVPFIYLLGTGLLTLAAFLRTPVESSLALGSILLGIPIYYALVPMRVCRNQNPTEATDPVREPPA